MFAPQLSSIFPHVPNFLLVASGFSAQNFPRVFYRKCQFLCGFPQWALSLSLSSDVRIPLTSPPSPSAHSRLQPGACCSLQPDYLTCPLLSVQNGVFSQGIGPPHPLQVVIQTSDSWPHGRAVGIPGTDGVGHQNQVC